MKKVKPCFCIRKDGDCSKCENYDRPKSDPEKFTCGWEYEDRHVAVIKEETS